MACRWRTETQIISTETLLLQAPLAPLADNPYLYPLPALRRAAVEEREFRVVILENDYLELIVLPELGGVIYRARMKAGADLFHFDPRVRFMPDEDGGYRLVSGLHFRLPPDRPATWSPVSWRVRSAPNGTLSLWLGDTDSVSGVEWCVGIHLRDDSSAIEMEVRLFNHGWQGCRSGFFVSSAIEPEAQIVQAPAQEMPSNLLPTFGADGDPVPVYSESAKSSFGPQDEGHPLKNPRSGSCEAFYNTGADCGVAHLFELRTGLSRRLVQDGSRRWWECGVGMDSGEVLVIPPQSALSWSQKWIGLHGLGQVTGVSEEMAFGAQPVQIQEQAGREEQRLIDYSVWGPDSAAAPEPVTARSWELRLLAVEAFWSGVLSVRAGDSVLRECGLELSPGSLWQETVEITASGTTGAALAGAGPGAAAQLWLEWTPANLSSSKRWPLGARSPHIRLEVATLAPPAENELQAASGESNNYISAPNLNFREQRKAAELASEEPQTRTGAWITLAYLDYRMGRTREARERLETGGRALSAAAASLHAEIAWEQNQDVPARHGWTALHRAGDPSGTAALKLAASYLARGEMAAAERWLFPASRAAVSAPGPRCALLSLAIRTGDVERVSELLDELTNLAPLNPAVCWLEQKRGGDEELVHPPVDYSPVLRATQVRSQDLPESQEKASAGGSQTLVPAALRADLRWAYLAGNQMVSLGLDHGLEPLEEAASGGLALPAYLLGSLAVRTGESDAASEWFRRASTMSTEHLFPHTYAERVALMAAREDNPADPTTAYYLGLWYLSRGNIPDARPLLEQAANSTTVGSQHPGALWALALLLCDAEELAAEPVAQASHDDLVRAANLLDKVIEKFPADPAPLLMRDRVAQRLAEPPRSRLDRMLLAEPSAFWHAGLAQSYARLLLLHVESDAAVSVLRAVISVPDQELAGASFPRSVIHEVNDLLIGALLYRGLERLTRWDLEEALNDIEEALGLGQSAGENSLQYPSWVSYPELLCWAGVCCYRLGRTTEAHGYWQAASTRERDKQGISRIWSALAMERLGGQQQSAALLETILAETGELVLEDAVEHDAAALEPWRVELMRAVSARALALYAVGERLEAEISLDWLASAFAGYPAGLYRDVVKTGALDFL